MSIPYRTLRATAQRFQTPAYFLSPKEAGQRDLLMKAATELFLEYGTTRITISGLAHALNWSTGKIRHFFSDVESIFAEVLIKHIENIIIELMPAASKPAEARRKLYLELTRGIGGHHTPVHMLLALHRHCLPPDLLETVTNARARLIEALCIRDSRDLDLLDLEAVNETNAEALLAIVENTPWRFTLEDDAAEPATTAELPAPPAAEPAQPQAKQATPADNTSNITPFCRTLHLNNPLPPRPPGSEATILSLAKPNKPRHPRRHH